MFTGLVQTMGTISSMLKEGSGRRLGIDAEDYASDVTIGESIAVNGCCLTVVQVADNTLTFEAGPETLNRTNLGALSAGDVVNLEKSLHVGDLLGGHFVTGHIDAVGELHLREDDEEWAMCSFRVPAELTIQMISKGSVAVDGVSLTLVDVTEEHFTVQLIPHTLAQTTLGALSPGGLVNIETDILAKYAQKAFTGEAP